MFPTRPEPAARCRRRRPGGSNQGLIRVWYPFVRVFHWSLVVLFATAWLTGDDVQWLHEPVGYVIAGLLAARIVWGFIGTKHSRFSDFVYAPAQVLSYLIDSARFRARRFLGHNPAGGAMVIALIVVIAGTASTGILMANEVFGKAHSLEDVREVLANMTLVLVALHLAGVVLASIEHRENLAKAMITGWKKR